MEQELPSNLGSGSTQKRPSPSQKMIVQFGLASNRIWTKSKSNLNKVEVKAEQGRSQSWTKSKSKLKKSKSKLNKVEVEAEQMDIGQWCSWWDSRSCPWWRRRTGSGPGKRTWWRNWNIITNKYTKLTFSCRSLLTLFYVAPEYRIWYSIPDFKKCT